jgi:hypothetical protein
LRSIPELHPLVASSIRDASLAQRDTIVEAARLVVNRGIRDRSDATRRILATGAQAGGTWESVREFAELHSPEAIANLSPDSAPWWRALGQITLLHAEDAEDEHLAAQFYAVARALDGHGTTNLMEYWSLVQSQLATGQASALSDLPPAPAWLPQVEADLVELDLIGVANGPATPEWIAMLNARIFETQDLAPIHLIPDGRTLFDRISGNTPTHMDDGPLISVIMTTYRRTDEIFTSLRSILDQSWTNFEVLVIDDASGPEFESLLMTIEQLDPRVRVIRQSENAGAYVCRNIALAHVHGEFVTFQDDDDWSHPQRLQHQVAPMLADNLVHSTLSHCLRMSEELTFRNSPAPASTRNASSLMFRARDVATLGGFDEVRKAGDTEFIQRLCAALPGHQVVIEECLALVRQTRGSLSRTDFGPGWSHPSRQEYWEAFAWWHTDIARSATSWTDTPRATRAFPAPRRFLSTKHLSSTQSSYDLVLVGDFGADSPWASRAWNFLQVALERKLTVGVIHLSNPAGDSGRITRIAPEVRQLIHSGRIARILPTDGVQVTSLFVTDASILEIQDATRWQLTCERATLVADSMPVESGFSSFWSIADVLTNTISMFGVRECHWVASTEAVHATLTVFGARCSEIDVPSFIYVRSIAVENRHRLKTPVIGRTAPDTQEGWPGDNAVFDAIYPVNGSADVRIRGDARALNKTGRATPRRWLFMPPDVGSFSTFVQQLDFYIYYADAAPTINEQREILAATAAGRVALVDERYSYLFGDAVIGCRAETIAPLISNLYRDETSYARQVDRGREALRTRFSPDAARKTLRQVTG